MISGIDIFCFFILLVTIFFAIRGGFLSAFLSVILAYLAIFLASAFANPASYTFRFLSVPYHVAYTILFLAVFVIIYIIGELLIWILKKVVSIKILGIFDVILAGILGGFKALLIMGVVFSLINTYTLSDVTNKMLEGSFFKRTSFKIYEKTYPFAQAAIPQLIKIARGEFDKRDIDVSGVNLSSEVVAKTINLVSREVIELSRELTP